MLLALLQEARSARQAAIVHRGGSGRQATARPLDVEFHRVPPPPTPYCPTPEVTPPTLHGLSGLLSILSIFHL